jgi:hypothetical protein
MKMLDIDKEERKLCTVLQRGELSPNGFHAVMNSTVLNMSKILIMFNAVPDHMYHKCRPKDINVLLLRQYVRNVVKVYEGYMCVGAMCNAMRCCSLPYVPDSLLHAWLQLHFL